MGDNIMRPDHYCEGREYEPKDVIRDWGLNFNLGSAVKYISRAGRKGDKLEDLQKAKQFLEFEIAAVEEENDGASRELFYKSLEAIDEYSKKVLKEEEEKRISAELLSRAVTRSENPIKFEDVPESLKPGVINNIAQEVLDSQIIPPDEVRAAVIDRIVERINSNELDCFDISYNLYNAYQDIRDAIARQALHKVGEKQKSDISMTCKEAAAIGEAMAKSFKEGLKDAEEKHDESELDIYCRGFDAGFDEGFKEAQSKKDVTCAFVCTSDVLNSKMKFEDVPEDLKPLVFKGIADEALSGMADISDDIFSDELREKIIDYTIEKLENGDLSPFDLPTYIMDHPRVADWGRSLQKILNRIHVEDSVEITFKFEKED